MFLFLRRRRSRNTTAAATRPVIEALESRRFLDGTTYIVDQTNSDAYFGAQNSADATHEWVHQWGVGQANLPDHSHTIASFGAQVEVNVDPNTGLSLTDGTQDDGYIYVSFNGQVINTIDVPAGTIGDTWVGGEVMSCAQEEGWEITTSENVFINVDAGNIQQGTSAGLALGVQAIRGGQDGSVTLSLDGTTRGLTVVYVAMPTNGIINLNNQLPDNQLPLADNGKQPYYTITGPLGIELDAADSHPELGFNVYMIGLPAGTAATPITFHMVTPFWGYDYNDGIYTTVLPQQPAPNVIAISPGWWDPNTNIYWAGNDGPQAQGLEVSDHTTDPANPELPANTIRTMANAMRNPSLMPSMDASLISGLAARSQYDHDILYACQASVGAKIPNVRTQAVTWLGGSWTWGSWMAVPPFWAPGSLWAWAVAGKLDANQTERVGLSDVDETVYGSADFVWNTPNNGISLNDPTIFIDPTVPLYEVVATASNGVAIRVIGGTPEANGYIFNQYFTPAQLSANLLVVQFAGLFPTSHVDIEVTITPLNLAGTVDTTKESWDFTSAVSVNWLQ